MCLKCLESIFISNDLLLFGFGRWAFGVGFWHWASHVGIARFGFWALVFWRCFLTFNFCLWLWAFGAGLRRWAFDVGLSTLAFWRMSLDANLWNIYKIEFSHILKFWRFSHLFSFQLAFWRVAQSDNRLQTFCHVLLGWRATSVSAAAVIPITRACIFAIKDRSLIVVDVERVALVAQPSSRWVEKDVSRGVAHVFSFEDWLKLVFWRVAQSDIDVDVDVDVIWFSWWVQFS